ncbi:outer membrane beta-barrel protein [Chitinophaga sp. 22321]|uniref:Outer membrane beta-barrel protein n=1 Tax=Chitinophaga hostae TaxID=2831022 RepID=A0ABS5J8T4_9BACT|nr:outer membrane beta-barrel family protein [Chitinophaga hostae]MBS0031627.1 outer membrane beta-barrel protein [Chitinophaga hostae]
MMKFSLALGLWLVLYCTGYAQSLITGVAVDNTTRAGIGFVSVSLLSAKDSLLVKGQIADSAGRFELPGISSGRYILLFSSFGYEKLYRDVACDGAADHTVHLDNISMAAIAKRLHEVIVSGTPPSFQRVAGKLVTTVAGNKFFAATANALDIIKKLPGLEVNGDGSISLSGRVTPAVFIDGKPVAMSPEELQNYLANLSPDMISSIEVIPNPSSRYDGEYKAIIDIKLKRDTTLGWKGSLSSGLQQNAYFLADNNLSLSYKTKQVSYTARLGYKAGSTIYKYSALQHLANTNIMATNNNVRTGNNNFNYQLGADYSFAKTQQIEIMGRAYLSDRDINALSTLHTTDAAAKQLVADIRTSNNSSPLQRTYGLNLNYGGQFSNTRLEILSNFLKIGNRQQEDIQTNNAASHTLLDYWKTDLKNDILIRSLQADLSGNIGKGKWNTGARFAFTTTKNNLQYDTLNTNGAFAPDSSRSNNFRYDEYISAVYAGYERPGNKLSYAISLRAEHTYSIGNTFSQQTVNTRNYLTWLPGVSVNFPVGARQQMNISYSRRMTRPNFAQLNPFRFYNSPLNYFVGNPYLQPSKTDMLRIDYTRNTLNISLFAGRETDPMGRYPEYDSVTNVLEYLGKNLPYNDFAGLEVSLPITVYKWWKMNNTIRGNYKKEQTPYHNVVYAYPVFDYTISGSQVFTLPPDITVDISYYYRSLSGNGLYILKSATSVDLGIQKSWLQGKLNSRLNYYDLFNTYQNSAVFREKTIINNALKHWFGSNRLALTLGYSFGRSTLKGKQQNKNEEENRAGM